MKFTTKILLLIAFIYFLLIFVSKSPYYKKTIYLTFNMKWNLSVT